MAISRRRLIQLGIGGTAALALGGGVLRWLTAGYALPAGDAAIGLDVKELCVVRAVVETLVPGGDGAPSGLELGVHQAIDAEIWAADDDLRSDVSAVLQLVEHLPPLYGHFSRFTRLSIADRERVLGAMFRSSQTALVQAATALKELCTVFYYANDRVWPSIGYDGPWVKTPRPPQSEIAYQKLLEARRRGAT